MTTIVKRIAKGSTLTVAELDANVTNLNNTKLETTGGTLTGLPVLANQDVDIISPVYPTTKPSLNLDFTRGQLDPRITFVRNSTAAYYDGRTTAKAEENLLSYSQDFRNTADAGSTRPWLYLGITNTYGAAIAPDGTTTANYLQETATTAIHILSSSTVNSVTLGSTAALTCSIYFKKGLGSTAPDWIQINTGGASNCYASFNLTTGLVGNYGGGSGISATNPINVGAGWYRCIITLATAGSGIHYFYPGFTNNTNPTSRYPSYLGTITSDVQMWGFQAEQRSSVTAYTPTTTAAITNYIPVLLSAPAGVARFDCDPLTGKSLGLLIEESRTNLLNFSSSFATSGGSQNNWADTNITRTAAAFVAPDSTQGGIQFTASAANATVISTAAVGTSLARTFSVWLKRISGTGVINYTLDNGATWIAQTITPTVTRYTFTATTANQQVGFQIVTAGDGIGIWGAQLEAGSFATSYIPTVASTVTRAADSASMTGTNFSSWYNQAQGSLYAESDDNGPNNNGAATLFNTGAAVNNAITFYGSGVLNTARLLVRLNTVYIINTSSSVTTQPIKQAASFKDGAVSCAANGSLFVTNVNVNIPHNLDTLYIGYFPGTVSYFTGHIRKLSYYPVALSSSELQGLTK